MAEKEKHVLNVSTRIGGGTSEARRQRKKGLIPAVVYSKGTENRMVSVVGSEWEALQKYELNLISLVEDGTEVLALLKEVQHDFIRNSAMHIDFMEVKQGQLITTRVAVRAHGEPKGLMQGGILDQVIHEVEVECTPASLPEFIEVDISALELGQSFHVRELVLPTGVKVLNPPELSVFLISDPNAQAESGASDEGGATEPEVIGAKEKAEKEAN